jgi:hypothetical protein
MKRIIAFLVALALLFLACSTKHIPLQRSFDQPVPVSRFLVTFDEIDMQEFEGRASGLIPDIVEGWEFIKAMKQVYEELKHPEQSSVRRMVDTLYQYLTEEFEQNLHLKLLPMDALENVQRDIFGVPVEGAESFLKKNHYPAAMEVEINADYSGGSQVDWELLFVGKQTYTVKPRISVKVKLVEANGTILWQDKTTWKSPQEVVLTRNWILGIRSGEKLEAPSPMDMIRQAIHYFVESNRPA